MGISIRPGASRSPTKLWPKRSFSAITGYTEAEVLGTNCRILQGAGTAPEAAGTSRTAEKRANANGAGAKVKVFIDPKTGQISRPPRNAVPAENLQKSVEESKEKTADLRETPSPRPGGGVMIDLKDHFRTPLMATRDAGGKLTIKHQSDSANSKENK